MLANAMIDVLQTIFPLTLASLDLSSPKSKNGRGDENKFSLVEMSTLPKSKSK